MKADRDRGHVSLPDLHAARAVGNWREWWPDDAAAALDDVRARLAAAVEVWELGDLRLLVLAVGRFSFRFDQAGNLVDPLSGKGQLFNVCAMID